MRRPRRSAAPPLPSSSPGLFVPWRHARRSAAVSACAARRSAAASVPAVAPSDPAAASAEAFVVVVTVVAAAAAAARRNAAAPARRARRSVSAGAPAVLPTRRGPARRPVAVSSLLVSRLSLPARASSPAAITRCAELHHRFGALVARVNLRSSKLPCLSRHTKSAC